MVQFDSAQLVLRPHDSFYPTLSFGFIPPVSKSTVRISASFRTRSGWMATAVRHFEMDEFSNLDFRTIRRKYDANSVGVFGYHRRQNLDNRRIEKEGWAHFEEALHGCVKVEVPAVTVVMVVLAAVMVAVLVVTVAIRVCSGRFAGHRDPSEQALPCAV
jgi:hypothetical protein